MEPLFIDKEVTVLKGDEALKKIQEKSKDRVVTDQGVTKVSEERWKEAQYYEHRTWMALHRHFNSDHNHDNLQDLNYCSYLKGLFFSNVIELGCGPFTNLRLILPEIVAEHVTLLDPLINDYLTHPHCSYVGRNLDGHDVECVASTIEDYQTTKKFDLVVMINVLPHCKDAHKVLDVIYDIMGTRSILVLHEPCMRMDTLPDLYDAGHPLAVTHKFLTDFIKKFDPIYLAEKQGNDVIDRYVCFAGRKKI